MQLFYYTYASIAVRFVPVSFRLYKARAKVNRLTLLLLCPAALAAVEIDESRRTAVVRAVERAQPAVVSVHVIHREPVYIIDPFRELFFPNSPYTYRYAGEKERVTGGSGLIVTEDGLVLTNDHVIAINEGRRRRRPPRIEVSLLDGRVLEAKYVDTDNFLDLAVLRVEASDLPVASLGRSSDIFVGEWTIAIGNPFDLGPTVTAGVVSAVDRDFQESKGNYHYRNMIQTDAAINPGNSGGPLVNALGEVIGINSFIYTGSNYSTGSIGIGFAIPVDAARRFLDEVRTHGRVRKPWTGIVDMTNFTPRLGRYLDLPISEGAIVTHVAVDSPASDSGLKRGDAIVAINGEKVRSEEEAWGILRSLRVGDTGSLAVVNTDGRHIVTFRLQEMQQQRQGWY